VVAELADRVVVMRHGARVEEGAVRNVLLTPTAGYTRQLLDAVPRIGSRGSSPALDAAPAVLEIESRQQLTGELLSFYVDDSLAVTGVPLADLPFPESAAVTLLVRGDSLIAPKGDTTLQPGDHVYVFSKPEVRLRLLFIHHSVGGAFLASPGREEELAPCIWRFHESGGGGRTCLERAGYEVHEASRGSRIGARTDVFDWLPKLRDQMEAILTCDRDDRLYKDGRRNDVVIFKSCFPNNRFAGEGAAPGCGKHAPECSSAFGPAQAGGGLRDRRDRFGSARGRGT
jgi:hypothetical protein